MKSESADAPGYRIVGTIINASYPRSGHRFLREILSRYFGDQFVFYDSYQINVVCKGTDERNSASANYVKTHDFELRGHQVLAGRFSGPRKYLVQIRHPLESIASYYEFSVRHGHVRTDKRTAWNSFLKDKLRYWKSFCNLWVLGNDDSSLLIHYSHLYADTLDTVKKIVVYMTEQAEVDSMRLERILQDQDFLQYAGDSCSRKSAPRELSSFKYFDYDRFRKIESDLLETFLEPAGIKPLLLTDRSSVNPRGQY